MYSILESWKNLNTRDKDFTRKKESLENLKFWLLENADLYPIFGDFKRRVLKPVFADFARVGYGAKWEATKTGKKTTHITFSIPRTKDKDKNQLVISVPPAPTAPVMRVNKDEPATINQVIQAAPAAQDIKSKVEERLTKLHLTPAQIKKVLEVVKGDDQLTKLHKAVYPLHLNHMQGVKDHGADNIGKLTVARLKTEFSAIYAAWSN
ncbi:hypothetical protein [Hymenobacter setariae]